MQISSYQINNVIKVYSRQVSQNRVISRQKNLGANERPSMDRINISVEGKRQTVIDKVSSDILNKLTRHGPSNDSEHQIIDRLNTEFGKQVQVNNRSKDKFVFNFIGENNEKITSSLSVEDSKLVSKRLEEIVKEVVNNNMERPEGTS
jgi:hypothetical protein